MECGDQQLFYVEGMFICADERAIDVQVKGETLTFTTPERMIGFCAGDDVGIAFYETDEEKKLISIERQDGSPLSYVNGEWFAEIVFVDSVDETTFLFDLYRSPYRDYERMTTDEPFSRERGTIMTVLFARQDGKNRLKKVVSG
ncbi:MULTISPECIES: hypothetical protein [unclassified Anoxybacillus]|uniref:hypothetical protein n=1 Tax=unclassified Anoxybacillus TaxID=2639704 RepID=UPI001EDA450C|nr:MULTISPECIES: hypothetical protein [unclassified Anoxybacillus]MCG5024555.1 hypothetical protein [Anoxybacillus flavithermus]MCG6196161.1 hypothetical protein [Anoxybacillus sp. LAT_38]MCG3083378.1 hypothetical protein [Anoxybacillus sp. LAT27]MCG6174399.1 hypothetical protein [Anoxybacillus sp. LAT_31]MCG6179744.1 hypothetical protein [Anoxybacillus sp. LAT_33]